MSPAKSVTSTVTLPPGSVEDRPAEPPSAKPVPQIIGRRAVDSLLAEHIQDEAQVWKNLAEWQKTLDGKIDLLVAGLAKNTEVCDEIRSYQVAGKVATQVVKWAGGIAAAIAGFVGLWAALKALTGIHPPGPQ